MPFFSCAHACYTYRSCALGVVSLRLGCSKVLVCVCERERDGIVCFAADCVFSYFQFWLFSVCVSVCLSVCLSVYLSVCLSICLSVCPSVKLSVRRFVCTMGAFAPSILRRRSLLSGLVRFVLASCSRTRTHTAMAKGTSWGRTAWA